ncbi:MAG: hypothetical protein N0E48_11800 [Candidatus Thiodiazotropha endolucinida]|nr:hypothetical protein [Candidatus Thiodiazotropha endolucinida]
MHTIDFIPLIIYIYVQSSEDTVSVSTYSEDSPPGSPSLLSELEEPAPRPKSMVATPKVQKRVSPPRAVALPPKKRHSTEVVSDQSTARLISIEEERLKVEQERLAIEKERLAIEKERLQLEKDRVPKLQQSTTYSTSADQGYSLWNLN